MPTFALIAALPLLLAPPATDRGAASVEVAAVEAEPPESAAAEPEPPPAAAPAAQPMPVPIQPPPPPPSNYLTPANAPDDPPRARKESTPRNWPERPIRWRVDLAGHLGTTTFFDRSWRAFDYSDRKALHVGATVRGDFRLGDGRVFLGGGATYQRFGSYGGVFNTLGTDILVREPLAFLRLSVVTLEGIDVFVQAGGGASVVDLFLSSTQYAEQRKVGAVVDSLAGLALYLPKKWLPRRGSARATGGLELGLGYTWRSKVPVRPTVSTGEEPIDTSAAAFGNLALHGLAWRLGLFVRFQ